MATLYLLASLEYKFGYMLHQIGRCKTRVTGHDVLPMLKQPKLFTNADLKEPKIFLKAYLHPRLIAVVCFCFESLYCPKA